MKARRMEALLAMARQSSSPHERDIAHAKLKTLGVDWETATPKAQPGAGNGVDGTHSASAYEEMIRQWEARRSERVRAEAELQKERRLARKRGLEERLNRALRSDYPDLPWLRLDAVTRAMEQAIQPTYRAGRGRDDTDDDLDRILRGIRDAEAGAYAGRPDPFRSSFDY